MRTVRHLSLLLLLLSLPALAQTTITGTVTNKTTNKPSPGDDVTLIQLKQGMQEATRAKTDARGHYKLAVPDDGIHLVRVTHQKANYFKPATPGTSTLDLDVYDVAEKVEGVSLGVQELHIEATDTELHIVEVLQVLNQSSPARTQFGPSGFDFWLPADAHILRTGAITEGGMPVQSPAVPLAEPGHYTFLFPVRPGETQFGIIFSLPYARFLKFSPKLAIPATTFAVILPKTMKFAPGPSAPFAPAPGNADTQTFSAQNVSPSQPLEFTVSGTGTLPQPKDKAPSNAGQSDTTGASQSDAASPDPTRFGGGMQKPLDPEADRDPLSKYKWWILGVLALLLAGAAGVLLRRPASPNRADPFPATPLPPAQNHQTMLQAALKEEMFALETDRLQKSISQETYLAQKHALDLILLRALQREHSPRTPTEPS